MNKKLLAVAIAGALAAPGAAFAQASSVTISGIFKLGVDYINYSQVPANVNTRINTSQARVVDNSSRIIFNVTEALGNDLSAVGQLDLRFAPNFGTINGGGNSWVGLNSKSWGRVTLGRHDLHYGKAPDDTATKAGALQATAVSLFDYINGVPIANGSRTGNVARYDMPTWMGLDLIAAWSANAVNTASLTGGVAGAVSSGDMTIANPTVNGTRRGDGFNLNPQYTNGPFQIGYSYWRAKPDAPGVAAVVGGVYSGAMDQRGDSLYTYYKTGGFKIGLGWNRSELDQAVPTAAFGAGTKVMGRTAWSIPMSYVTGPHNFVGHYTRANGASGPAGTINNSGARMVALAYVYDLSARTSVGLTYARINNDLNASYNFFTNTGLASADGGAGASQGVQAGESPRLLQGTIRHAF